jgi:hypothetical protein
MPHHHQQLDTAHSPEADDRPNGMPQVVRRLAEIAEEVTAAA